jgi:excisionase family DNA binding protein
MENEELNGRISRVEERVERLEKELIKGRGRTQKDRRMLTTEEAAVYLGMTVDGIRGLTSKKLIPFYKPNGKNMYFEVDELVAWQKRHHFEAIYPETLNP